MPVTIKNLTADPMWLSFNSGDTKRLSPGQTSGEIPDVEVTNHSKIEKMARQRLIVIQHTEGSAVPAGHAQAKPVEADSADESSAEPVAEDAGRLVEESKGAARPHAVKKSGPGS